MVSDGAARTSVRTHESARVRKPAAAQTTFSQVLRVPVCRRYLPRFPVVTMSQNRAFIK